MVRGCNSVSNRIETYHQYVCRFPEHWWMVGLVVVALVTSQNKLSRHQLVLVQVTIFGGPTIPVFIYATQSHSAWPSLCGWVQRLLSTGEGSR